MLASASGVGLAVIQLAKHMGMEVNVLFGFRYRIFIIGRNITGRNIRLE